jgi:hypothetical protein
MHLMPLLKARIRSSSLFGSLLFVSAHAFADFQITLPMIIRNVWTTRMPEETGLFLITSVTGFLLYSVMLLKSKMMRRTRKNMLIGTGIVLLVSGIGSAIVVRYQTTRDFQMICDLFAKPMSREERMYHAIAQWKERTRSRQADEALNIALSVDPSVRRALLESAAQEAGVRNFSCPNADRN